MENVTIKDLDILSEQDKSEAIALLSRYEQMDAQEKCKTDSNLKNNVISKLLDITPEYSEENNQSISKFLKQKKHYIAVKDLFKQGGVKT